MWHVDPYIYINTLIIIVLQECFIKSQVHETTQYYTKCFTVQHTYKVAYNYNIVATLACIVIDCYRMKDNMMNN